MTTRNYAIERVGSPESFSLVSILSVLSAIGAFWVSSGILALLLALFAILCGVLGLVLAISPAHRGGVLSLVAIFAGVIGIIAAIVKLAGNLL